jgi:MarR family transcriptional regulator for hemolysin
MSNDLSNPNIETKIEFSFIDIINLWRNKLGNLAKHHKMSRLERRIVVFIGRYPSLRQSDLATYMDVEPQSLTRALDAMEKKGWIVKTDNLKDKRAKCINFTAEGKTKLEAAVKIGDEIRERILKNVSLEEKQFLDKILTSIQENLKGI